jgi:F-type H+-transporting ATPase subunit a
MEELKSGLDWAFPLPGLKGHGAVVATNALLVALAILVVFFIVCRRAKVKPGVPQLLLEMVVQTGEKFLRDIGGERTVKYLPFCMALFLFILFANLVGLVPGFVSPTGDVNVNLAMAACVFIMTFYVGIRELGIKKYLRHKMGPVVALGPVFFLLESVGELARPVSLTLRLFGNIRGEDIFALVISNLTTNVGELLPVLAPAAPVISFAMAQTAMQAVYVLMVITSFLQAFIFSFLPILYFGAAVGWGEEEH